MEYLTAKEANAIAEEALSVDGSFMRQETDKLMEEIAKSARAGATTRSFAFSLHKVLQDRLKKLGYGVKVTYDQRDGDWTTISW